MTHVEPGIGLPGDLRCSDPSAATPVSRQAGAPARATAPLGRGERELIATYGAEWNGTEFCSASHSAFAAARLADGREVVKAVPTDQAAAPVSGRVHAVPKIAAEVRQAARPVAEDAGAHARAAGADDAGVHDTALIASVSCMRNRWVGSAASRLAADSDYCMAASQIVAQGCLPRASAA